MDVGKWVLDHDVLGAVHSSYFGGDLGSVVSILASAEWPRMSLNVGFIQPCFGAEVAMTTSLASWMCW